MGATLDETRVELEAQRARTRATAAQLEAATRRAVDLRAKVRDNPVQTATLVAGAAFFFLGGPRRTVRMLRHVIRGSTDSERAYASLPASLRTLVDASAPGSGAERSEARRQLAMALQAWREDPKNRKRAERLVSETLAPPGAERAFWALVEIAAVTAAGIIARRVVARRLTEELLTPRPAGSGPESGGAAGAQYSGWSGQRPTPSGPTAEPAKPLAEPAKPVAEPAKSAPESS